MKCCMKLKQKIKAKTEEIGKSREARRHMTEERVF